MAIANYTKKINGMRSIPQSHTIRSSKNYLKTTPERYMTPPDIFDLVLILRALMHHLSGIFGFLIGWGMTKNHFRIVSRERSLKCMLCSKCNGRLLLTFSGQKGSRFSGPYGIARSISPGREISAKANTGVPIGFRGKKNSERPKANTGIPGLFRELEWLGNRGY